MIIACYEGYNQKIVCIEDFWSLSLDWSIDQPIESYYYYVTDFLI